MSQPRYEYVQPQHYPPSQAHGAPAGPNPYSAPYRPESQSYTPVYQAASDTTPLVADRNGALLPASAPTKPPSAFGFVALTLILIIVGFAIQINGTMDSSSTPILLYDKEGTRFSAFFFVFTWLSSLISLHQKRPALLSISAGMFVAICFIVEPFTYLDVLRRNANQYSEDKKALIGGIFGYIGAGGMFFMTARYLEGVKPPQAEFTAVFSVLVFVGSLVLNFIGSVCLLREGYVADASVFMSVCFVFLTSVLFRSPSLISTTAVLSAVLLVHYLQVVLVVRSVLDPQALTGFVTFWLSSLGFILYRYSIPSADEEPSVSGLPQATRAYGTYDGNASLAPSDNIGLSATNSSTRVTDFPTVAPSHHPSPSYPNPYAAQQVDASAYHTQSGPAVTPGYGVSGNYHQPASYGYTAQNVNQNPPSYGNPYSG